MKVLPRDLGTRWHIALVRQRIQGPASVFVGSHFRTIENETPTLGVLGQLWSHRLGGVSPDVARETLPPAAKKTLLGLFYGVGMTVGWIPPLFLLLAFSDRSLPEVMISTFFTAVSTYGIGYALPRMAFRRYHETLLRPHEIEAMRINGTNLLPGMPPLVNEIASLLSKRFLPQPSTPQTDELEEAFWTLVLDVMRTSNVPKEREDDVRATLSALGDAVAGLPVAAAQLSVSEDAADIVADAESVVARAHREADPVIAASLLRQADALIERARAAQHAALLGRRTRTLRDELRAQIEALRTALPALSRASEAGTTSTNNTNADAAFERIAESVRGVASQAASLLDAHEELDQALRGTHPTATDDSVTTPTYQTTITQPSTESQRLRQGGRG